MDGKTFMCNQEVQEVLHIKVSKAAQIIKQLNQELAAKGYIVVRGRVPRKYFMERMGLECSG